MSKEKKNKKWIGWKRDYYPDPKSLLLQENKSKWNLEELRWQEGKYFKDFPEREFTKLENWLWGWQR